jgi:hypothetical protein
LGLLGARAPQRGAARARWFRENGWEFLLSKKVVRFVRFVVTGSVCGAKRAPHTERNYRRELCKVCKTGAPVCFLLYPQKTHQPLDTRKPKRFEDSGNREKGKSK